MEVLKKGSKGELVKQLQKALNISVDGIFGNDTEVAVKKFQQDNGLVADGVVGKQTLNMLSSKNLDSDLTSVVIPKLDIENYYLNKNQYLTGKYSNDYIVLHHTAGHDNPKQVVDCWNTDALGKVATEYVLGGLNSVNGRSTYDGKIIRTYPEGCQGYHIGKSGSSYMNTHSVGIEICNIGWAKNGKSYVGSVIQPNQIVTLKEPFRGYTQWQRYTDKQIESLKQLLLYIANRDNIDLHTGLYQWIKKEGAKAFEFKEDAYYGKVKGMVTHGNIRKDKFDLFPQPEMMDMILSL